MEPSEVKAKIVAVVQNIHKKLNPQDQEQPEVTGMTCPGSNLNKFDSKIWPVAISRIAKKLEVEIPDDEKLFGDSNGKMYTIDQITERVCALIKKQEKNKEAKVASQ
jgi:hypothetical protein